MEVQPTLPVRFIPQELSSTGTAIVSKQVAEYPSNEYSAFCRDVGGQIQLKYRVSSNKIMDFTTSKFRWPVSVWHDSGDDSINLFALGPNNPNAGVASTGGLLKVGSRTWTDLGGVHALIEKITITARESNTVLQEIDGYNRLVAQLTASGALFTPDQREQLDWSELMMGDYGASTDQYALISASGEARGTVIVSAQNEQPSLNHHQRPRLFGQCQARDAQKGMWGDGDGLKDIDSAVKKRDLVFLPYMSFFRRNPAFPIYLLSGGIEITFTLASSTEALVRQQGGDPTTFSAQSQIYPRFRIDDSRFLATVYEVDRPLMKHYEDAFSSQIGLLYYLPNWRLLSNTTGSLTSGTASQVWQLGHRSVRRGFGFIQQRVIARAMTKYAVGGGHYQVSNRSLSHGLLSKIQSYYFQVGNLQFPINQQRVRSQTQALAAEAGQYPHELVKSITDILSISGLGVSPWEYQPSLAYVCVGHRGYPLDVGSIDYPLSARYAYGFGGNAPSYTAVETMCCQFPVNFSRDDSFLCGIDLSHIPLTWYYTRPSAIDTATELICPDTNTYPYVYNFAYEYDSVLQLQSGGINVLE